MTDKITFDDPDRYEAAAAAVTAERHYAQAEVEALTAVSTAAESATLIDPGDDLGGAAVIAAYAAFTGALAATVASARDNLASASAGFARTGPALTALQTEIDTISETGAEIVESTGR